MAELSQRVSHSTTRSYLSAVRHLHISKGYGDPLANTPRLNLVLKGAKQLRPGAPDTRLPITPLILRRIKSTLLQDPYNYDHLMLWAACCLGFFAFLRSGELAVPDTKQFDPAWHLTPQDLAFDSEVEPSVLQVHLKGSKTDQLRAGVHLYVGATGNELCPIAAVVTYLAVRGMEPGPLFRLQSGQPLTRAHFVDKVRSAMKAAGMDPSGYSGHCFRIGASTTAAANGVGDATIQILGRWSSDSYKRYIRVPRDELAQLARTLAK